MASKSSTFHFDTCCFCISLRKGCFIMAYMQLVGITLGLIYAGVVIGLAVNKANEKHQHISSLWIVIITLLFLTILFSITFKIVLLIGLHKNKPGYVKAYLIFNIIFTVIFAVLIMSSVLSGHANPLVIIIRIIQLWLIIYIFLVYRSYYINMKETSKQTV